MVAKDAQRESWKTTLNPRGLNENRHSDSLKKGQLTISQGKMKRGDDAADDDMVRTSVSQDRVTAVTVTIVPQDSI
jgi:hypothetical protein